jgi:hypothetical protein
MTRTKKNIKEELNTNSLLDKLTPIMNYLISIENNPISDDKSQFIYTLGIPSNWIINTNDIHVDILKEINNLKLVKISPTDTEESIDNFFNYIVTIVNKNIEIDKKRLELEEEIDKLKSKFDAEQKNLMDDLFKVKEDE